MAHLQQGEYLFETVPEFHDQRVVGLWGYVSGSKVKNYMGLMFWWNGFLYDLSID